MVLKNTLITAEQDINGHARDEVERAIRVVAAGLAQQAAFTQQPLIQPGAQRGVQQPDHRGDDAAFLDKGDQPVEDGQRIAVEPDDESSLHLQPLALDRLHACQ